MMDQDVEAYIRGLTSLVKGPDVQPKKTNALERCFNRALTQVLFTGRRSVTTVDLYLAMMAESNSHAHYFLLKYGVKKNEFVAFWEKNYTHGDITITDQQATEILEEHCTNLTTMAKEGRLEPMIGRSAELDEMITVLARKFKANVLMVGDPGVGKTAIVEGLAQEINAGRVPEFLKDHEVWSMEIGSLHRIQERVGGGVQRLTVAVPVPHPTCVRYAGSTERGALLRATHLQNQQFTNTSMPSGLRTSRW
jgi:ATP-dependent Clp protease ATP-binding subunit ClpA